ncbi:MAG: transporter substrate-binding domain-containing protein [Bermanella sp.]
MTFLSSMLWGDEITVAMSHFPPRKIVVEEKVSGIDADILREVARRMDMDIKFVSCPWLRCQRLVMDGKVDFMTSAVWTKERDGYAHFINPPYVTNSTFHFYVLANANVHIHKYEDLYKYKVGDVRGAVKFERFDNDGKIQKYFITADEQLIKVLVANRVDVIVGQESQFDYMIQSQGYGQVKKSSYKYVTNTSPVFMALSRKSKQAKHAKQFSKIMAQLIDEGVVEKIKAKYRLQ